MKILQIGQSNWSEQVDELPENLEWLFVHLKPFQTF